MKNNTPPTIMISAFRYLFTLTITGFLVTGCFVSDTDDTPDAVDGKVETLLARMTLEEKAGQMSNVALRALCKGEFFDGRDTIELDPEKMERLLKSHMIGSVQNMGKYPLTPEEWRGFINAIQAYVKKETRLGIPVLYGIDGVHGANYSVGSTLLPHQLGLAATWNPQLAETAGRITAYEIKASGIAWNYGPTLDVSKQPLWGRISETFGEDTYLTGVMSDAMLKGARGEDVAGPYQTLMCPKHFIAYGSSHSGKDRSPVYLPERIIRQYYLPPFQSAVEQGVVSIMVNSGSVNGTPCHADKYLLTDVLKGEMGFEGFLISDWSDVMNLVELHQVAKDEKEAVMLAVNAGLDMCMEPYDESFTVHLVELVNEGLVSMERINDATRRILKAKFKAGLFEQTVHPQNLYPDYGSEKFADASLETALESMTLLKNENSVLPIPEGKKILVTGVGANSLNYLNGGWSRTWGGEETAYNDEEKMTVKEALETTFNSKNITYIEGTGFDEDINTAQAKSLAKSADYIVVCLGEKPATEVPSNTHELNLPKAQADLVREVAISGKPVILVLLQGRPRTIRDIEPLADAILMAYYPGNEGGRAIAQVLSGEFNPCGKLPYTYPRNTGEIWPYDHVYADKRDNNWGFNGFNPQFEFGFGLSYTTFGFSNLEISKNEINRSDALDISVRVTNTGKLEGKEVVQLYVADKVASITPAVRQLKRFEKISLAPGQSRKVAFSLYINDLKFVGKDNQWTVEPGAFDIMIDTLKATFILK